MVRKMLAVSALVLVCTATAWSRDNKEDMKFMEGTWLPVSGELGGEKEAIEKTLKDSRLVIKDGKYTYTVGDRTDGGTITLDASKKPKQMDIVGTEGPNKDKKILAIYEVGENSLKICYALEKESPERPKEFKSETGTKNLLITWKRQKP